MSRALLVSSGALLLAASCAHVNDATAEPESEAQVPGDLAMSDYYYADPLGPQMNPKRKKALYKLASGPMSCPPEQLTVSFFASFEVNLHLYDVKGCGGSTSWMLHCMGGVCNWRQVPDAVAARALDCHGKDLTRSYAGDGDFTYRGCGKAQTYVHRPKGEWRVIPAALAPPAPTSAR